jgi:hypothetical protein
MELEQRQKMLAAAKAAQSKFDEEGFTLSAANRQRNNLVRGDAGNAPLNN